MEIWTFAKGTGYTIVTFDADFLNLATLKGHPPKIILLKTGNRTTIEIASLLIKNKDLIVSFLEDKNYSMVACLEIS